MFDHDDARPPVEVADLSDAVDAALGRIAPVWKLEDFVAVNPYLGLTHLPVTDAAAVLRRVAGARSTMPIAHRLHQVQEGLIDAVSLADAVAAGRPDRAVDVDGFLAEASAATELDVAAPALAIAAAVEGPAGVGLTRLGVERLGAWASAHHDEGQASWSSTRRDGGLFGSWREEAAVDRTAEVLGLRGLRAAVAALPEEADRALEEVLEAAALSREQLELYLHALLLGLIGWSSVAARMDWELGLRGGTGTNLREWLAVLVCWDHVVGAVAGGPGTLQRWRDRLTERLERDTAELEVAWILQDAADRAARRRLATAVARRGSAATSGGARAQVVCCIDVRSEVLRRHLEAVAPDVETLGFAGFFGAPVEVVPLGHDHAVAQCPALIAPTHSLSESLEDPARTDRAVRSRRLRHQLRSAWKQFKTGAVSCYGFVSPIGLLYAPKLLGDAYGRTRPAPDPARTELPRWVDDGDRLRAAVARLPLADQVAMASGALEGMSRTSGGPPLLVLLGHGSNTVNNPHAAALDCGACGGHSGAANARVMAALLNSPAVRAELAASGIVLEEGTHVVAGLHDTTTDDVTLFDAAEVPAHLRRSFEQLRDELRAAGRRANVERVQRMHPDGAEPEQVRAAAEVARRSRDWAQVRPEWGLAGCRAFVAAPRSRTSSLDLSSQVFLHTYDPASDPDHQVLTQIMCAPMVVASWITLQYFGSTVDPQLFGAGDKTLHNVVGRIGVLEGCGGDLRVGLAQQSVHDGAVYQHDPLRLAVYLEADPAAIDGVLSTQPGVAELVDNGWVLLHAIDPADGSVLERRRGGSWVPLASGSEVERDPGAVDPLDRRGGRPDVVDVVG